MLVSLFTAATAHSAPAIAVFPSSLTFTGQVYSAIAPQMITVSNSGDTDLTYTITSDVFWLSVSNASGTLAAGQATTHVVRVATRGLDPRNYQGHLTISDSAAFNSPQQVTVNLAVTGVVPPSKVVAWGSSYYGELDVPDGLTNAIAVGGDRNYSLALLSDGRVTSWGGHYDDEADTPPDLTNAVALSSGIGFAIALRSDGTVSAFGTRYTGVGQTDVPPGLSNVVAIEAGMIHSLALKSDGTVVTWGWNHYGQVYVPSDLSNVVAISAGTYQSAALKADGTIAVWGDNYWGSTNIPPGLSNVVAVSAGVGHVLALKSDGTVVAWGQNVGENMGAYPYTNYAGQCDVPVDLSNVVNVVAGTYYSMALRSDGSLVLWGSDKYSVSTETNIPPPGLNHVLALNAGYDHTLVVVPAQSLTVGSAQGSPSPVVGTSWLTMDELVAASVDASITDGGTQYVNAGWVGSGSVPASGTSNSVTFTITNDSSLTWLWQTNYELAVSTDSNGIVNSAGGWYTSGSNVVITAIPNVGYGVLSWTGDTNGCAINGSQITVPMTQARSISVQFTGVPLIALGTTNLAFTGQVYSAIAPQTLVVSNSGNADLNYTIASDMFWLSVSNASGMLAAGQSATHTINVATRGLDPRNYQGHLSVTDPTAFNSPQQVTVKLGIARIVPPSKVVAWGYNQDGETNVPAGLTNAVNVSAGTSHALVLKDDGTVVAWGNDFFGTTTVPVGLSNVVAVQAAFVYSLALCSDGHVNAWGGLNYVGPTNAPPPDVTNLVAISSKGNFGLGLLASGAVVVWGDNYYGQTNMPPGLTNVVAVAAGGEHSTALRSDGTVVGWGLNWYGETNVPVGLSNVVAIAAGGEHSIALRSDGTVTGWGANGNGQTTPPTNLNDVVAICAGAQYSMALRSDGTVVAWGRDYHGETYVPIGLVGAVAIDASFGNFSLALVPMRQLTVSSVYGSPIPSVGTNWPSRNVEQMCSVDSPLTDGGTQYVCTGWTGSGDVPAAGTSNSVAFTITNNSSITWLWQTNYQLTVSTGSGGTASTSGGWYTSGSNVVITAIPNAGYGVLLWTGDTNDCVVNGSQITVPMTQARSISVQFTGVPLIALGTTNLAFTGQVYSAIAPQTLVVSNSGNADLNYTISSDMFWLSVSNASGTLAAGQATTHVVRVATRGLDPRQYQGHLVVADTNAMSSPQVTDVSLVLTGVVPPSKIIGWGLNSFGQTDAPDSLTNAVAVGGDLQYSLALLSDGHVASWGGQHEGDADTPPDLTNAVALSSGIGFAIALRSDGTVSAFGTQYTGVGQTNVPPGLSDVVAIDAGTMNSLALKSDGTVVAWGWNRNGQVYVPSDLSNVVAISAGTYQSAALKADGTIAVWGNNYWGSTNIPPGLSNVVAVSAGVGHVLALKSDGTVVAWGLNMGDVPFTNYSGQCDVPADLSNVVNVAAGTFYSLALCADGSLVSWGRDVLYLNNETNIPPTGLNHVLAFNAGYDHGLAVVPARSLIVGSAQGSPSPVVGTSWLTMDELVAASVDASITDGGTQYVNAGWVGSGSVPASGTSNSVTFTITNDSSLTWLWQTNYWLGSGTNGSGSVVPTSGWFVAGSAVTITAAPSEYWHFSTWSGDVAAEDATSAVVTLGMTMPLSVMAEFVANRTSNDVPETWLAEHGITNNFNDAETNDPDGDGMTTLEEYIADLDPMSATSSFVIATTSSTNGFAISIPSSTGRVYSLDSITNLLSPYWRSISDQTDVPGNGGTLTLTTTNAGGRRVYYRVRVALPQE